jgi:hypothetical protein
VAAPVPLPSAREAERLVEGLGSGDYREREAATRRLDELGPLALDALRAACKSDNPEIADRAKDLVRKIERRMASDRLVAPTLVGLDAKDAPLDDILAALSKQAGCDIVLGGSKAEELAAKKLTLETGKVPFWLAVLKVCDAAGLQVAGAGGFVAPGTAPYRAPRDAQIRVATNVDRAVVLEAREGKKRPASVHGAVLVEAIDAPKLAPAGQASTVIQFWPEPRVSWQSVSSVTLAKAMDDKGRRLTHDTSVAPPRPTNGRISDGTASTIGVGDRSGLNVRQALVKFRPGEWATPVASELTGAAFALVRTPAEPLVTLTLDPAKRVEVTGKSGTEARAELSSADGKTFVTVQVAHDRVAVQPALARDELPGVATAGEGNRTVHGVRVTDADGRAFPLSLADARDDSTRGRPTTTLYLKLELAVVKDGPTKPAKLTFWATTAKPVEVPFMLKDVPLAGARR